MSGVVAVDLGNTNTVVAAVADGGEAEVLALDGLSQPAGDLPPLIPTLVYVHDAGAVRLSAGEAVRAAGLERLDDGRLFRGFKRRLAAQAPGLDPVLDGVEVTAERVAGWFVTELLGRVPELDRSGDTMVFTVPVGAFQVYLRWLEQLQPVRHWQAVDESTAAALGYRVAAPGRRVLVVDLGGGTLDCSLVRLPERFEPDGKPVVATVLAKASQVLGGDDIDTWLLALAAARCGLADEQLAAHPSLRLAAEAAKIELSTAPLATFAAELDGRALRCRLSRDDLEDLLVRHEFLSRLQQSLESVLRQAERKGVGKDDLEQVLLVGGTARMPAVRRAVMQVFGAARVRCDDVFCAAAKGAVHLGRGYVVRDFLFHSYGVRGWNHQAGRHEYDLVVPALTAYPFEQPVVREYAASSPGQPAMEVYLGEIEHADLARPEVVVQDRQVRVLNAPAALHRYALVEADRVMPLNNGTVVPLDPPGHPGVNRLRLAFMVDARRRLTVSAYDLQTNKVLLDSSPIATLT